MEPPRPRPRLGALLLDQELVTEAQLVEALRVHEEMGRPLGEILTENLGLVSVAALRDTLLLQQRWRPLGTILVERGVLGEEQLLEALDEQERSGRQLGEIVRERFYVSSNALDEALREQRELQIEIERGYASGLRDALQRRARGSADEEQRAPDGGRRTLGLSDRFSPAADGAHMHLALKTVESRDVRIDSLNQLLERQRAELKHLREALTERRLTVIELEQRVAELEALLPADS